MIRSPSTLVVVLMIAACGGGPTQPGGRDDEVPREVLQFPTFRADVMEIFVRNTCTSDCHSDGQGGLTIVASDPNLSHAQLVDVMAHSEDFLRIEPFNPDDSYVVIKVEGRNAVGSPMPPGDALDSIDLQNLRNWISQGAQNN